MKWSNLLLSAILATSLVGCEFQPKKRADDSQTQQDQTTQQDQAQSADLQGGYDVKSLDDPNSPLSRRVIYFDLDSSSISEEDRELIRAHADFLVANPHISAILEGHADERGTREYNYALGMRRANAVKDYLTKKGISSRRIKTVSYGEDRYRWYGERTEMPSASLCTTYSGLFDAIDLSLWGSYFRMKSTDGYLDETTLDSSVEINWNTKDLLVPEIKWALQIGYQQYRDNIYPDSSYDALSASLLFKLPF